MILSFGDHVVVEARVLRVLLVDSKTYGGPKQLMWWEAGRGLKGRKSWGGGTPWPGQPVMGRGPEAYPLPVGDSKSDPSWVNLPGIVRVRRFSLPAPLEGVVIGFKRLQEGRGATEGDGSWWTPFAHIPVYQIAVRTEGLADILVAVEEDVGQLASPYAIL